MSDTKRRTHLPFTFTNCCDVYFPQLDSEFLVDERGQVRSGPRVIRERCELVSETRCGSLACFPARSDMMQDNEETGLSGAIEFDIDEIADLLEEVTNITKSAGGDDCCVIHHLRCPQ